MADLMDEQDYFGGLGQDLLGKYRAPPAIGAGLGAALTQGLHAAQLPQVNTTGIRPTNSTTHPGGDYATVTDYTSGGSAPSLDSGHLGLSVNGGPAYGLEPSPGLGILPMTGHEPPHPLQLLTQLLNVVPGEMDLIPADRPIGDQVTLPLTHDQAQLMRQYQLGHAGPTLYSLPFHDCVTSVSDALESANVNTPSTLTNLTPAQFVRALHAMYDKPVPAPP